MMFTCFTIEYFEDMGTEELKELIKKEVTLRGLLKGKSENSKFKILHSKKEVFEKKVVFVFVYEEENEITATSELELFAEGILCLEEENQILQIKD